MAGFELIPPADPTLPASGQFELVPPSSAAPPEQTSALQAGLIGAGHWLDTSAAGLRQALPDSVVSAVDKLGSLLGMAPATGLTPEAQKANAPAFAQVEQQHPISTFLGGLAPSMAATSPAAMALLAGIQPGTAGERATNAGLGFAGGTLGELAGSGLARLFGPASRAAGTAANEYGIPQTVGQTTGYKPAQIAESVLAKLPGGAGVMAEAKDAQFKAFNQAVAGMIGTDGSQLTPEVIGAAKDAAGQARGDIAARNMLTFDDPLNAGLDAVKQRATQELMPNEAALVHSQINHVLSQFGPDGTMSGTTWKGINTGLGNAMSHGGPLGNVIGDLRTVLQDGMDRSMSPEDQAAWTKAGHDYYNALQVGNATAATPGILSPSKLLTQVNSFQRNARYGSGNDLAQLAQWAKPNLGDAIPESGTAPREFYQKMMTTPLDTIAGVASVGALAGLPAMYVLSRALAGQPASAFTKDMLQRGGLTLGGIAAPRLLGSQ